MRFTSAYVIYEWYLWAVDITLKASATIRLVGGPYLKDGITTSGGLLSGGDPGAAGIISGWGEWAMLLRAS